MLIRSCCIFVVQFLVLELEHPWTLAQGNTVVVLPKCRMSPLVNIRSDVMETSHISPLPLTQKDGIFDSSSNHHDCVVNGEHSTHYILREV